MFASWSRRRAAVAQEAAAAQAPEPVAVEDSQTFAEDATDEEILTELGLPDPETMQMGDDFKAFMTKTVPQHLRKRALRTLWRSNPVLACVDGLNDYDDDYLTGSFGQGPIKTSYQVGKGMLAHVLEMERQKEAALMPQEEETSEVEVAEVEAHEVMEPEAEAPADQHSEEVQDVAAAEEPMTPAPRRMQFQFEGDAA